MAEKLSVTIALVGGKEIEKQLADIGEAGQKAFADIGNAAEKAGGGFSDLKPDEVAKKLEALGLKGTEAFNKIQSAVKNAARLETLVQGVATVEAAFTALAQNAVPIIGTIGAGFVSVTRLALAWADAVNKASAEAMKLGVGVEQLDKLRQGFEKAGISSEATADGLRKVKAGLDQLDVDRVKQAFDIMRASADGIGSSAMKALQAAAEGTGKAADDARVAFVKLADEQRKISLQTDVQSTEARVKRASEAVAQLSQVPIGTPGRAAELSRLSAQLDNASIAADRAKQALSTFAPSPAPLTGFAAAMEKLGIAGGKLGDVMPQIVDKFRAMPDGAKRTALAFELLGDKMGPELIAALQTGSAGIDMFTQKWAGMTQAQALEAAKTQQMLNQLSSDWNRFKADLIAPIAVPLLKFVRSELDGLKSGIQSTVDEFARLGGFLVSLGSLGVDSFWNKLGAAIVGAAGAVGDFISRIAGITWDTISGAGLAAWNAVTDAIGNTITAVSNFISTIAGVGWDAISGAGVAAWNAVTGAISNTITMVGQFVSSIASIVWDTISSAGVAAWNAITNAINSAIEAIKSFLGLKGSSAGSAGGAGGGSSGFAGGGLLGGRGTGTSDSNLAWVSRGEHIMPARAVAQPGVLAFLEALRRSGGDLGRVLNGLGRFATGGLVAMPAFASGGIGGMSHVTIAFPGLPAISGLRASSDVVAELQRAAAMAQVRSGGRKPSRYT